MDMQIQKVCKDLNDLVDSQMTELERRKQHRDEQIKKVRTDCDKLIELQSKGYSEQKICEIMDIGLSYLHNLQKEVKKQIQVGRIVRLHKDGMGVKDISEKVGVSEMFVRNMIDIYERSKGEMQ